MGLIDSGEVVSIACREVVSIDSGEVVSIDSGEVVLIDRRKVVLIDSRAVAALEIFESIIRSTQARQHFHAKLPDSLQRKQ
jgi:hypothetical protein